MGHVSLLAPPSHVPVQMTWGIGVLVSLHYDMQETDCLRLSQVVYTFSLGAHHVRRLLGGAPVEPKQLIHSPCSHSWPLVNLPVALLLLMCAQVAGRFVPCVAIPQLCPALRHTLTNVWHQTMGSFMHCYSLVCIAFSVYGLSSVCMFAWYGCRCCSMMCVLDRALWYVSGWRCVLEA
jgi:hypothetical protein